MINSKATASKISMEIEGKQHVKKVKADGRHSLVYTGEALSDGEYKCRLDALRVYRTGLKRVPL